MGSSLFTHSHVSHVIAEHLTLCNHNNNSAIIVLGQGIVAGSYKLAGKKKISSDILQQVMDHHLY